MKNLEGLKTGDKVELTKGEYKFVGVLTTSFSSLQQKDLPFVQAPCRDGRGTTGYFLDWYEWDLIRKLA